MKPTRYFLSFIFTTMGLSLLLVSTLSGYVAKINDYTIDVTELQEFVDVQKFLVKADNLDELLSRNDVTVSSLLSDYIDMMVLYLVADTKNYSFAKKNKAIVAAYQDTRQDQITTLFVNRQLDIANNPPSEAELRAEFEKVKSRTTKTFKELNRQEQNNLYQISILRRIQNKKRDYRISLEKKYKVKRTPRNNNVVATVNNTKISRKKIDELLTKEVGKLGISLDNLRKSEPEKFQTIRKDAINELIFQEMIREEIKKSRFTEQKVVKSALKFYQYQIAIEEYVKNELADSIRISDNELDEAFIEVSKSRPEIQKLLPTQQESLLRSIIIQNKLPQLMEEVLNERKEESIIRRNKAEFSKIK